MSDSIIKGILAAVTTPEECLQELLKNWMFLSGDPYYADMRAALLEMVERCAQP